MEAVVEFNFRLPVRVRQEGKYCVAWCPLLDISSQGLNRDESIAHLIEATQVFLESCFERGVLDEVLKQCGFSPTSGWHGQCFEADDIMTVPFELVAARNGASAHCN